MPKFHKRHGQWEMRFKKSKRTPSEKTESLPLETPVAKVRELEYEMNLAYKRDWDPWQQSFKDYNMGEAITHRSVIEAVDYHIRKCINGGYWNSPKSVKNAKGVLYRFADMVGRNEDVTVLREFHIQDFIDLCGENTPAGEVAKTTRNLYLRILKGLYNRLRREGIHQVRVELKKSRIKDETIKYYKKEELIKICRHFTSHIKGTHDLIWPYYDKLWIIMFFQGLRISEALSLTPADFDGKMLRIEGKWDKTRLIELLVPAKDAFFTLLNRASSEHSPIADVSGNSVRRMLKKCNRAVFSAQEQAREFTPHSLRHGGATYWLSQGVSIYTIRDYWGHENIETTFKYAKLIPGYKSSEFDKAWHKDVYGEDTEDKAGFREAR